MREQLEEHLDDYLDDEDCDWLNLTWKKINIDLNKLDKFSTTQLSNTMNWLMAYRLGVGLNSVKDDTKRHESLKRYILENGTWPKPLVVVNYDSDTHEKYVKGWNVRDGHHRLVQAINISNIFFMKQKLGQASVHKLFQALNYNKLNDTHEIWLGEVSE